MSVLPSVCTHPSPTACSPTISWKPTAHRHGENQKPGSQWVAGCGGCSSRAPPSETHHCLSCLMATLKNPLSKLSLCEPTPSSPSANSLSPGVICKNNQRQLLNTADAWMTAGANDRLTKGLKEKVGEARHPQGHLGVLGF